MLKNLSLILGLMFVISACGHDSDKADPAPTPVVLKSPPAATLPLGLTSTTDDANVIGLWQTECKPCATASFCRQALDISTSSLQARLDQFADKACSVGQAHIRYFGSYTNVQGLLSSQLAQTHMKLDIASFQSAAEFAQSCGFNSWPLETWLDVTGHICPATPEKGGVWTELTQPGKVLLRSRYTIDGPSLTFIFSDGKVVYSRVP